MKKRIIRATYFLFMFALLIVFTNANIEKISNSILNSSDEQKIRVVIHLKDDLSNKSLSTLPTSKSLVPLEEINYQNKNNIFASLSKKEIEQLSNLDKVESITKEKKYEIFLQDSVPLINATRGWSLQSSEINLTGNGQTICIIDTGVNYSHPDLGGCFGNNNIYSNCKIIGGWNTVSNNLDIMDDNGHGTHVSGIASANGSILGVSPFSKIVMIKANIGNGFDSVDVIEGIDWCINNASKFNISVISLSLGVNCGLYPEYCYSGYCNNESEADSINLAVANNISVVIATGNNYLPNLISSPACIENATPVTSTNKGDTNISSFANTWDNPLLSILAAPGENINSTIITGSYSGNTWNGTSMATPHVAGAIAILNQYLKSINNNKTPSEIESLLNSTGKQIYDSYSERFFSRIDIYSALMIIDKTSPVVTLFSLLNISTSTDQNQTLFCNSTDWQLENTTLFLWNSTGIYSNIQTKNTSGIKNSTEFNLTDLPFGNYEWNCLSSDKNGNIAFAANNLSLSITKIVPSLIFPINDTYTNSNETIFNCSATVSLDREIKNMTFYIFENETLLNYSTINLTGTVNSSLFAFTFINETNYVWGCGIYSNDSNYNSKNYTIHYDSSFPILTAINEVATTNQVIITWTTSEETNYSISLNTLTNESFSYNHILIINDLYASTTYNYNLTYCDRTGNCDLIIRSFVTDSIPIQRSSGGGGGGGGSGITTTSLTESQISSGVSKKFIIGEKTNMIINGQNHSIQLNKIINNSINITIKSEPINIVMGVGDEKKLNLTSNEYYDLDIKIDNITKNYANITIQRIQEPINPFPADKKNDTINNTTNKSKKYEIFNNNTNTSKINLIPLYTILLVLVIVFIYFSLLKRFFTHSKKKD